MSQHWQNEYSIETTASPEAIWGAFVDVPGWKRWNPGIEEIALEGPFAVGSAMQMKPPGQDAMRSTLVEVRTHEGFTDETRVGDIVVRVAHRIARLDGRTRVTFAVDVEGPEAHEIGPAVSGDFPQVLQALAAHLEARS